MSRKHLVEIEDEKVPLRGFFMAQAPVRDLNMGEVAEQAVVWLEPLALELLASQGCAVAAGSWLSTKPASSCTKPKWTP